ncbi:ABC transporter ATP-binding protein [Caballeronia grimmiae]|uniref:ABC transporter ATPase n=2 Tax=Caballeronia grimmiae TaxID=1071679 RepID=A0A069P5E8_9BURK|nr:ABC transporter ATP-binding protein [Caballeronia grimmiae]KDR35119.1 ABC transporter ATPase [Caballeronia grimmiae]
MLLQVHRLNVDYGAHRAVRDLSFDIAAGESLALVGESGCGKSTTAMSLMRLLPKHALTQGTARFEGVDLLSAPESRLADLRGSRMSMIFQEPMTSLNPVLSIGTQVAEALILHRGMSRTAAKKRAIELLDLVRIPEPARRADDHPHHLSGGQRQRAMIAAAIACEPVLLIADEPTTALDVTVQAGILRLLDDLRRDLSMALLLITHDLGVVSDWADRVIVMHDGQSVEAGPTREVLDRPRHAYSRGLLGAALDLSADKHYRDARLPEIRAVLSPAGKPDFALHVPERAVRSDLPASNAPFLSVDHVNTVYATSRGARHVVRDVSFDISRGETLGLVGESGCGKSSLSRTIMRLIEPQSGRIVLDGADIAKLSRRELVPHRHKMQMVFQDPYASLNPRKTIGQILAFALDVQGTVPRRDRERKINAMLDAVGLPASAAKRHAHEFSGGQRQRIGIARALILEPALLICDEPVSALDVSIQAQILNLLCDLKDQFGLSMLFISHDLAVVRYIADRVMVMQDGRIVERGGHDEIWSKPSHPYTRALIASVAGQRHGASSDPVAA